jgi:hypothetical protein
MKKIDLCKIKLLAVKIILFNSLALHGVACDRSKKSFEKEESKQIVIPAKDIHKNPGAISFHIGDLFVFQNNNSQSGILIIEKQDLMKKELHYYWRIYPNRDLTQDPGSKVIRGGRSIANSKNNYLITFGPFQFTWNIESNDNGWLLIPPRTSIKIYFGHDYLDTHDMNTIHADFKGWKGITISNKIHYVKIEKNVKQEIEDFNQKMDAIKIDAINRMNQQKKKFDLYEKMIDEAKNSSSGNSETAGSDSSSPAKSGDNTSFKE